MKQRVINLLLIVAVCAATLYLIDYFLTQSLNEKEIEKIEQLPDNTK